MKRFILFALALSNMALLAPVVLAQSQPRRPPEEAIQACVDLSAGDACSFASPDGNDLIGQCFTPDPQKPLACRPEDAPEDCEGGGREEGRAGRRPPKEAIDACAERSAGDACSFEDPRGEALKGQCFTPDKDKPLACRPDSAPGKGGQKGKGQRRPPREDQGDF